MCGISSLFKYGQFEQTDREKLNRMNREMKYRGPDEDDVWNDSCCGLAHTRLSIIGLENGHQPIFNEDKTLVLICNGEIYNYKELTAKLTAHGHTFRTQTDCEVILHLYEDHGTSCLEYLRGMFAFCLYDSNKKLLFSARDRIGEKTLYFAQVPCGVVFSTELKAIVNNYVDDPQVDVSLLAECIRFGYPIELRHTYVQQVFRLQPGEYALVDQGGLRIKPYWNRYTLPTFDGTKEEATKKVLEIMRESVTNCLQSDVPVGILLSGGIDSSAIAHFAKETGKEIHCISAGYKGQFECDERTIARRFAEKQGIVYHEIELDANDYKSFFEEYISYIDEPVADIASIAQWGLYKKAKKLGFTVLLGGLGGDELFYGYPVFNKLGEYLKAWHKLEETNSRIEWLKTLLMNLKRIDPHRRMRLNDIWPVDWTRPSYLQFAKTASLYTNGANSIFKDIDVSFSFPYNSNVKTVYDLLFSRFMTTQCLYLADRLGMGNSVELRSPFVDYKLVEFVSSLPLEIKYDKKEPKHFLKEIFSDFLTNEILYGSKKGFTPPSPFIQELCDEYKYKIIKGDFVFFNSMLADKLLSNMLS
ncbi:MAG: asparagine synthase (glutamine-hydrolyzing) [Prevotella sp.]|nr:asparagine synthase (glutamine-hydrolyzing) [Prevotella sp.]